MQLARRCALPRVAVLVFFVLLFACVLPVEVARAQTPSAPQVTRAAADKREAVPDAKACQKAVAELKREFKTLYAAGGIDARRRTADELFVHYSKPKRTTSVEAYVVLDQAREQAILGLDLAQAFDVIAVLDKRFAVDGRALRLSAVEAIVPKAREAERPAVIAIVARFARDSMRAGDFESAEKALKPARALATSAKDAKLGALLDPVSEELARNAGLARAEAELAKNPSDPAANLAVGTAHLERGDLERALKSLALAPPGALGDLARKDASNPTASAAQIELANAWSAAAGPLAGKARAAALARSRFWAAAAWGSAAADALAAASQALDAASSVLAALPRSGDPKAVADANELEEIVTAGLLSIPVIRGTLRDDREPEREIGFELAVKELARESGRASAVLRWSAEGGNTLALEGEWSRGDDILWLRSIPSAPQEANSAAWLFELRMPTRALPRGAFQIQGAWRSGARGGVAVLGGEFPTLASVPRELELAFRTMPGAFGGRRKSVNGMSESTEKAVLEGLRWLLRHQSADGSWHSSTSATPCPVGAAGASCFAGFSTSTPDLDVEVTSLALLAFLGAGYHQASEQVIVDLVLEKRFEIGPVIRRGLQWLAARQAADGRCTQNPTRLYSEALAATVFCEANGLRPGILWKEPAQNALAFLVAMQRPPGADARGRGWPVFAAPPPAGAFALEHESNGAVAASCITALYTGTLSGFAPPEAASLSALERLSSANADDWRVPAATWAPELASRVASFRDHESTSAALRILTRALAAHDIADASLASASKELLADLPSARDAGDIDYDHWNHATYALFQFLGPRSPKASADAWKRWNEALTGAVLDLQEVSDKACSRGGWLRPDRRALLGGGPVYSTAINVLTLEVYYRYENEFAQK